MNNNDQSRLDKYRETYERVNMSDDAYELMRKKIEQGKKDKVNMRSRKKYSGFMVAAAAAFVLVVLPNTSSEVAYAMNNIPLLGGLFQVVTFRDYQYEDEHQAADVTVPQISVDLDSDDDAAVTAKKSSAKVNAEIREITDKWVEEFKANIGEEGYKDIIIKSEVVSKTDRYFTLKLICYQSAGSGYEEDHFYTIDLKSGERMELADLFEKDSDYRSVISENIKDQMRAQMAADDAVSYFVDDEEVPEWNFDEITKDASFYVNENNEVVICFNEGDVAPMCMGTVEFTIPNDVVEIIRSK